jgi:hypothetical protein
MVFESNQPRDAVRISEKYHFLGLFQTPTSKWTPFFSILRLLAIVLSMGLANVECYSAHRRVVRRAR